MPSRRNFTPPRLPVLRWLTYPGPDVSPEVSTLLLGELFSSPAAVIAGVLNGLILNIVALALDEGRIFGFFIILDLFVAVFRIRVGLRALHDSANGLRTQTDLCLITGAGWCAIQGVMVFSAMRTGNPSLQILSAMTGMGLVAPICARNYGAPRYAMMLVIFCDLSLVAGAGLSGNPWLLVLLAQTPLFLFGVRLIIGRFQNIAVSALQAERKSNVRARQDALTGLLNRFGLIEMLREQDVGELNILFYLDLDGFKPVNDLYGHQAGDTVLEIVAQRLQSVTRSQDVLSRFGGDEFVILARNMTPDEAPRYADSIIRAVARDPFLLPGLPPIRVGISVGFACSPEDGPYTGNLQRADAALYEAKQAGRGTYRRFRPRALASA